MKRKIKQKNVSNRKRISKRVYERISNIKKKRKTNSSNLKTTEDKDGKN